MVGKNLRSRSNRNRKKRKNNRNLMIFLALAFLFLTILLAIIVLNKNAESEVQQEEPTQEQQEKESKKESKKESNKESNENEPDATESKDEKEKKGEKDEKDDSDDESSEETTVSITELSPDEIEDSNVLKAYVGEWETLGTNQTGSHTTNYQNDSEDRIEIKKAVSNVTEIAEENMVEWRVENGGDQKVIATVSDNNEEEYFRVYLTWIDKEGWEVDKLEHLKRNDKK